MLAVLPPGCVSRWNVVGEVTTVVACGKAQVIYPQKPLDCVKVGTLCSEEEVATGPQGLKGHSEWGNVQSSPVCRLGHQLSSRPHRTESQATLMPTFHEVSPWERGYGFWLDILRGPQAACCGADPIVPLRGR